MNLSEHFETTARGNPPAALSPCNTELWIPVPKQLIFTCKEVLENPFSEILLVSFVFSLFLFLTPTSTVGFSHNLIPVPLTKRLFYTMVPSIPCATQTNFLFALVTTLYFWVLPECNIYNLTWTLPSEKQEQHLFQFQAQLETASFAVAHDFLNLSPFGLTHARIHACLKSRLYFKNKPRQFRPF